MSQPYGGSKYDKAIIDEEDWTFPKGIVVNENGGFQGHEQKGVIIRRPVRKPSNRQLTKKQKASNKAKAKKRIKVEHCIGYIKIYRIGKEGIRIRKDNAGTR